MGELLVPASSRMQISLDQCPHGLREEQASFCCAMCETVNYTPCSMPRWHVDHELPQLAL